MPHAPSRELFEYSCRHIRWLHRSAHDCIFGEPGETIAPWITLEDDLALKRKTLECLVWLAEYSLMISVSHYAGRDMLETTLDKLVMDMLALAAPGDGAQIVSNMHDLIASAFPGSDRRICRKELQDIRTRHCLIPTEVWPLYSMWETVLGTGQLGYIEPLVDKPFASMICSVLLSSPINREEALMGCLLKCISRDLQRRPDVGKIATDFLPNWRFGFACSSEFYLATVNQTMVLSWLGSRDHDEASIMHGLATLLGPRTLSSAHSWQQVVALMEARDAWRGLQVIDDDHDNGNSAVATHEVEQCR